MKVGCTDERTTQGRASGTTTQHTSLAAGIPAQGHSREAFVWCRRLSITIRHHTINHAMHKPRRTRSCFIDVTVTEATVTAPCSGKTSRVNRLFIPCKHSRSAPAQRGRNCLSRVGSCRQRPPDCMQVVRPNGYIVYFTNSPLLTTRPPPGYKPPVRMSVDIPLPTSPPSPERTPSPPDKPYSAVVARIKR